MPLPSEETTPPVTKMYLVVGPSVLVMVSVIEPVRLSRTPIAKMPAPPAGGGCVEILGCIDAERVVRGLHRLDADAVFERAQLFEGLGAFERGRVRARQAPAAPAPIA